MNQQDILMQIKEAFKGVTLGNAYTLAEEDYYDTSHWHFDEKHINNNLTREEWDRQEIEGMSNHGWWLAEEIDEAIGCIQEKRKMNNTFLDPFCIPLIYLETYYWGMVFLQPQAFLFYTPSVMLNVLSSSNPNAFNLMVFTSWFYRLSGANDDDWSREKLKCFNTMQINTVIACLSYCMRLGNIHHFDKEDIQQAINGLNFYQKTRANDLI